MAVSPTSEIVVLAGNAAAAELAGYRLRRGCTVVTPQNLAIALRGRCLDDTVRVIAVGLNKFEADTILEDLNVAPAWAPYGKPTVEHVSTH